MSAILPSPLRSRERGCLLGGFLFNLPGTSQVHQDDRENLRPVSPLDSGQLHELSLVPSGPNHTLNEILLPANQGVDCQIKLL